MHAFIGKTLAAATLALLTGCAATVPAQSDLSSVQTRPSPGAARMTPPPDASAPLVTFVPRIRGNNVAVLQIEVNYRPQGSDTRYHVFPGDHLVSIYLSGGEWHGAVTTYPGQTVAAFDIDR